jgi:histidinol phosphatase-like enzyme
VKELGHPLVVDLDGTLILTDSLYETLLSMLQLHPFEVFKLIKVYFLGKGEFKKFVYERSDFKVNKLPCSS